MTVTVPADRIYTLLKEAGYRLTKPRRAVAQVLLAGQTPLSIEEIHSRLGDRSINRVSVYRTVQLFCDLGIVRRLQFHEGFARYELAEVQRPQARRAAALPGTPPAFLPAAAWHR